MVDFVWRVVYRWLDAHVFVDVFFFLNNFN